MSSGLKRAKECLDGEDYEGALKAADSAISGSSNSTDALLIRSKALSKLDRNDEAAESLERAVELDPSRSQAWRGLAEALRQTGNLVGESWALEGAISLEEPGDRKERLLDRLGEVTSKAERKDKIELLTPMTRPIDAWAEEARVAASQSCHFRSAACQTLLRNLTPTIAKHAPMCLRRLVARAQGIQDGSQRESAWQQLQECAQAALEFVAEMADADEVQATFHWISRAGICLVEEREYYDGDLREIPRAFFQESPPRDDPHGLAAAAALGQPVTLDEGQKAVQALTEKESGPGPICWAVAEQVAISCSWEKGKEALKKCIQAIKCRQEAKLHGYSIVELRLRARLAECIAEAEDEAKGVRALELLRGNDPVPLSRLAKILARRGEVDSAGKRVLELENTWPSDTIIQSSAKAIVAYYKGAADECAGLLSTQVVPFPTGDTPENRLFLALAYVALGSHYQWDRQYAYTQLVAAAKGPAWYKSSALTHLSKWYSENGDGKRASLCAQRAVEADPSNKMAAEQLVDVDNSAKAHEALKEAINLSAGSEKRLCTKLVDLAKDAGIKVWALQKALRHELHDAWLWERLGKEYARQGSKGAAIKSLRRAWELDSSKCSALAICAMQELLIGELQQAKQSSERALTQDPTCVEALLSKARTFLALSKESRKLCAYGRALLYGKEACDASEVLLNHANPFEYGDTGSPGEALVTASHAPLHLAQLLLELTCKSGEEIELRASQAEMRLRRLVKLDPSNAEARYELSLAMLLSPSAGKRSWRMAFSAVANGPHLSAYWHLLSWAAEMNRSKRLLLARALHLNAANCGAWIDMAFLPDMSEDEKRNAIDNARASNPEDPRVWDIMAIRFHAKGETDNALASFRMARDLKGGPQADVRYACESFAEGEIERADAFAAAVRACAVWNDRWAVAAKAIALAARGLHRQADEAAQSVDHLPPRLKEVYERARSSLEASDRLQRHCLHNSPTCSRHAPLGEASEDCRVCVAKAIHFDPSDSRMRSRLSQRSRQFLL